MHFRNLTHADLEAPMELPGVRWRNIDVEPGNDRAVEQIAAECLSGPTDPVVAYRGRRRFTEALELVPLALREETPLRQGGVYLITGGLGDIGLVLADYLARTFRARLVLTARRGMPEPAELPGYLATHGAADPTSRRSRARPMPRRRTRSRAPPAAGATRGCR